MSTLRKAIEIALSAHDGQTDKAGAPYILHPLRVMLSVTEPDAQIAAMLHDVVEDSDDWSVERLRGEGFSPAVLEMVGALTKEESEHYVDYLERLSNVPAAIPVKLGDLADNLDVSRLPKPLTSDDHDRLDRYRKARDTLLMIQHSGKKVD